jgi:hypothetical protein
MPANNRKQSPRRQTNLEERYGKIGISAVEAAVRYSSAGKRMHRALKGAGETAAKQRREPPK